jgi:hypothetical protein
MPLHITLLFSYSYPRNTLWIYQKKHQKATFSRIPPEIRLLFIPKVASPIHVDQKRTALLEQERNKGTHM